MALNAIHIPFRTNRFNLSQVSEDFINPCCFGEDIALWFRAKLGEQHYDVSSPWQEDWGWQLSAKREPNRYRLSFSGNSKGDSQDPNDGQWRIIVEKRRSIADRIHGRGKIGVNDAFVQTIENMLKSEPQIRDVRNETPRY